MANAPLQIADGRRQYHILRLLGQGGYGTVYLAELRGPAGLEKQVAIKVTAASSLSRSAAAHLIDEARMLVRVRHSAIVQVDNLIRLDGAVAMVMEYVDGASLRAIWKRGPVPPRAALEIIDVLARALDTALSQPGPDGRPLNLIHRDIKPENVIVTASGDVKLLDFGLARADIADRLARTTMVGQIPFTEGYRAPERLVNKEFGPPADIYALGVVLFELLTAETLGDARGNARQHRAYIDARMEPLEEQLGPDSPVIALVKSLLAHQADERPTTRPLARQCSSLFGKVPGERLFEWASTAVPAAQRAMPSPTADGRVDRVFSEETLMTAEPDHSEEDTSAMRPVADATPAVTDPVHTDPARSEPTDEPTEPRRVTRSPDPVSLLTRVNRLLWTGETLARTWTKRVSVTLASATSLVLAGQQLVDRVRPPPQSCAEEICNGKDDDCDGQIDDADPSLLASTRTTWRRDADGDGLGDDAATVLACAAPPAMVDVGGDCDDHSAAITRDPVRGCAPVPETVLPATVAPPVETPPTSSSRRQPQRAPTGRIAVKGDPKTVLLEGEGGSYTIDGASARSVKPGVYSVRVIFAETGTTPRDGGTVTIGAGQTSTLTCRSDLESCG